MTQTTVEPPPIVQAPPAKPQRRPQPDSHAKPKRQPPYAVIVLNDNDHTIPYVIDVLQRICGHKLPRAMELTWQIHTSGQAAVWTGSREVAELKRDQIRGFGPDFFAAQTVRYPLGVRIEPMPQG